MRAKNNDRARSNPGSTIRRITLLFAVSAITWILLSDRILLMFVPTQSLAIWQRAADWLFFLVTYAAFAFIYFKQTTHHKQIEENLRAQEERVNLAMKVTNTGTWVWEMATGNAIWSDENYQLLGLEPNSEKSSYELWSSCIHPDDRDYASKMVSQAIENRTDLDFEYRAVWADGSVHWLQDIGKMVFDEQGNPIGMYGIQIDVTERKNTEQALWQQNQKLAEINQNLELQISERKRAEQENEKLAEQLRQAHKMEALGRLAGGIAHDFNNLLVPIIGYTELSMINLPEDSKLYTNLDYIKQASERAAALIAQILAFSRKQVLEMKTVALNNIVSEFEVMIKRVIGEDIELHIDLNPVLCNVTADRSQIEQILMNLSANARDAMPNGGTLTIETDNIFLDGDYAETHIEVQPGHYAVISISDTGHGFDRETQKHLFEPFFTTKTNKKGTGLGLATVFGIVKQHQGNISCYSEPGQGTTFKIYLPRSQDSLQEGHALEDKVADVTGTETILLVEDEAKVRSLIHDALETYGYLVIPAQTPAEALQLVEKHSPQINLLLTDVIMPGMNGKELYEALLPSMPTVKVLYMSGYTANVITHHGVLNQGVNFLQKPFSIWQLVKKIRGVLDLR